MRRVVVGCGGLVTTSVTGPGYSYGREVTPISTSGFRSSARGALLHLAERRTSKQTFIYAGSVTTKFAMALHGSG